MTDKNEKKWDYAPSIHDDPTVPATLLLELKQALEEETTSFDRYIFLAGSQSELRAREEEIIGYVTETDEAVSRKQYNQMNPLKQRSITLFK